MDLSNNCKGGERGSICAWVPLWMYAWWHASVVVEETQSWEGQHTEHCSNSWDVISGHGYGNFGWKKSDGEKTVDYTLLQQAGFVPALVNSIVSVNLFLCSKCFLSLCQHIFWIPRKKTNNNYYIKLLNETQSRTFSKIQLRTVI